MVKKTHQIFVFKDEIMQLFICILEVNIVNSLYMILLQIKSELSGAVWTFTSILTKDRL